MTRQFLKDSLGWGLVLWFIGYALSMVLFSIVPHSIIGWVIMPIGTLMTLWVLLKRIQTEAVPYYVTLSIIWTFIAVVLDYLCIVKTFKPTDGYYKSDVYLYYVLTFTIPIIVGWYKKTRFSR